MRSLSAHPTRAPPPGAHRVLLALQDQTAGSVEGPAFRILIDLDRTHLEIENETIALSPGMAVEAAIVLGRQRVIEYVLHPLRGYRQDAFREK